MFSYHVIVVFIAFGFIQDVLSTQCKSETIYTRETQQAELRCPYPSIVVTWTNHMNTIIFLYGEINPNLTKNNKYSLQPVNEEEHSLVVNNFTEIDMGIYRCQMTEINGTLFCSEFRIEICRIPVDGKTLEKTNNALSSGFIKQTEMLICPNTRTLKIETVTPGKPWNGTLVMKTDEDTRSSVFDLPTEYYECSRVDKDLCSLNESFILRIKWLFNSTYADGQMVNLQFTCDCTETICDQKINVLYFEQTLVLISERPLPDNRIDCILQKKTERDKEAGHAMIYGIIVASGICVICLCVFSCLLIKALIKKKSQLDGRNPSNNGIPYVLRNSTGEEYSSIERRSREQMAVGNPVSYDIVATDNPQSMPQCHNETRTHVNRQSMDITDNTAPAIPDRQKTRQLNYSEVQFNKSTSELKVVIGEDRRTPYADIDLTLKADPLPESDSSDDETGANDNDFITLGEMQALGKSRGNAHEDDY